MFKDEKRNLIITDREYRLDKNNNQNKKWYKYTCNVCGWTKGWIEESKLTTSKKGCSCCANRTAVLGINTIWDTHKWLVDDFGLYEEFAKTNTYGVKDKGIFICKDCGNILKKNTRDVIERKSIGCTCGDGRSYPEKFMTNILVQLDIGFMTQLNKTTFKWCDKYKYDFYIPKNNMIIETHGIQHYEKKKGFYKTLGEEQENDRCKEKLARENRIENYVVIDCRYSDLEWIKDNILKSKLNELFDLSKINWLKCEESALKNTVKEVCEYWKNKNDNETTNDLAKIFKCSRSAITQYLKNGTKLGWVNYDEKIEMKKSAIKNGKSNCKRVLIFKDGVMIHKSFESCNALARVSEELFGVKLTANGISSVCTGKIKQHKGYTFKYI